MHAKKIVIVGFLVVALLFSAGFNQAAPNEYQIEETAFEPREVSIDPGVTLYDITHEDNFTQFGFSGSGTQGDPYLLEGNSTTYDLGNIIEISDQTAYWKIKSCDFVSSSTSRYGIRIDNSNNGIIEGCTFTTIRGIYAYRANNTLISNCIMDGCDYGTYMHDSYFIEVSDNFMQDMTNAVFFSDAPNTTIQRNEFDIAYYAIRDNGLSDYSVCHENSIRNLYGTGAGIYVSSSYMNITNNLIVNTTSYGIYDNAAYSYYQRIENNTLIDIGDYGIYQDYNSFCTIRNNKLRNIGDHAIYLDYIWSFTVEGNEIANTTYRGIDIVSGEDVLIQNNILNTFFDYGFFFINTNSCVVTDNKIHHGQIGMVLSTGCHHNVLYNNHFSNHTTNDTYDNAGNTNNTWWYSPTLNGNYYSESHSAPYLIPGGSGNVDGAPNILIDGTGPGIVNEPDIEMFDYETRTINWNVFDIHPWNYTLKLDGSVIDSGYWISSLDISYTFEGLSLGVHTAQLVIWDAYMNEQIDQVQITVSEGDNVVPDIEGLSDADVEPSFDYYELSWNITDDNPDTVTYYVNDVVQNSVSYTTEFNTELDISVLGDYNCTIEVNDTFGNVAVDTVLISVIDTIPPTYSVMGAYTIEYGSGDGVPFAINDFYTWDSSGTLWIYENGTLTNTTVLTSNTSIVYHLDGTDLGVYNITYVYEDASSNGLTCMGWVTLEDTTAPTCSNINDFSMIEGDMNIWMNWTCSDFLPDSYLITLNESTVLASGSWDGSDINYLLDNAGLRDGVWNITLTLYDTSGNSVVRTTIVTVYADSSSTSTTTTTTTTTGEPTPPPGPDMSVMIIFASAGIGIILVVVIIYFLKVRK